MCLHWPWPGAPEERKREVASTASRHTAGSAAHQLLLIGQDKAAEVEEIIKCPLSLQVVLHSVCVCVCVCARGGRGRCTDHDDDKPPATVEHDRS